MPGRRPQELKLSPTEREELEKLVKRPSSAQQIAQRGRIILNADAGKNHAEIARELNISIDMARLWRQRWLDLATSNLPMSERLLDAYRPGAPAKFTLEQQVQLMALACEDPKQSGRPISHWTAQELADEMVKRSMVESISRRHVGRLLQEADLKPHALPLLALSPPLTHSLSSK